MRLLVSAAEKAFITEGVEGNLRTDGRRRDEIRKIEVKTAEVVQADGCARVRMGKTEVLVGVKVEVGDPREDSPNTGRVEVTVTCSATASPDYVGRGGDALETELTAALERIYFQTPAGTAGGLDLSKLGILPKRSCWVVHIDGLVLCNDGGLLDALSFAAKAALAQTRVPQLELVEGDEGQEAEFEVDDYGACVSLDASGVPVSVTVSQVGRLCAVDLTAAEEAACTASLHMAVDGKGRVLGVTQHGMAGIRPSVLVEMMEIAEQFAPQVLTSLDKCIIGMQEE